MPFIPLGDSNPRILLRYPWVTWGTILACILIYAAQISDGLQLSVYNYGFIPAVFAGDARLSDELLQLPPVLTLFTSMYLHGSLMHLLGNMLFLWVFGDNIEDSMGHVRFLFFYLLCGAVAGLSHFAAQPLSDIPMVGASGAISGVLAAYLVLHPRARILIPIVFFPVRLPAFLLLAGWFAFQIYAVIADSGFGNVAWWAHIGGFVAGLILVFPFKRNTAVLFGGNAPPQGIVQRKTYGAHESRDRNPRRKRESPMPNTGETPRRPKGPWDRSG